MLNTIISSEKTIAQAIYLVKGVRNVMGTLVTISAICPEKDEGRIALTAAFDEINRINDLMSVHKDSSEVSVLNREGRYRGLSPDTRYVIQRARRFSEMSDGAFDITVLPLLKFWEEKARSGRVPNDSEINERLGLVNYRNLVVEGDSVQFRKEGMGITLAGVAKGYAVDKAIESLKRHNIHHALVNAGGDIRVTGGKAENMPWKIAVRDPINKKRLAARFELYDRAVATSGAYTRRFNDILDPRTGRPACGISSSTVVADMAIDADILATTIYILGAERGAGLIGRLNGIEALAINNDGDILDLKREKS